MAEIEDGTPRLRQQVERSSRFASFCEGENGLFSLLDATERAYLEDIATSDHDATSVREAAYVHVAVLRKIKAALREVIGSGKVSAHELKKQLEIRDGKAKAFH